MKAIHGKARACQKSAARDHPQLASQLPAVRPCPALDLERATERRLTGAQRDLVGEMLDRLRPVGHLDDQIVYALGNLARLAADELSAAFKPPEHVRLRSSVGDSAIR
jgi:hypothetical protein